MMPPLRTGLRCCMKISDEERIEAARFLRDCDCIGCSCIRCSEISETLLYEAVHCPKCGAIIKRCA